MTKNWLTTFMSPFKWLRRQSTTFSKERNVVNISHGIGQHGQSIVSSLSCRGNISTLKRRRISSLRITKRYSVGCQEYWDNVLQVSLSSFRPIHCQMDRDDSVERGLDAL